MTFDPTFLELDIFPLSNSIPAPLASDKFGYYGLTYCFIDNFGSNFCMLLLFGLLAEICWLIL